VGQQAGEAKTEWGSETAGDSRQEKIDRTGEDPCFAASPVSMEIRVQVCDRNRVSIRVRARTSDAESGTGGAYAVTFP